MALLLIGVKGNCRHYWQLLALIIVNGILMELLFSNKLQPLAVDVIGNINKVWRAKITSRDAG